MYTQRFFAKFCRLISATVLAAVLVGTLPLNAFAVANTHAPAREKATSSIPNDVFEQANSSAGSTKQLIGTQQLPLVVRLIPDEMRAKGHSAEDKQSSSPWVELGTLVSTVLTAIATLVLAIYTFRLAKETAHLRELANDQSGDTKSMLEITRRSAEAAIALERPIFIIESTYLALGLSKIHIGNHGRTPGSIVGDYLVITQADELAATPHYAPEYFSRTPEPRIVDPAKTYAIERQFGPSTENLNHAVQGIKKLWAYGYVEYVDYLKERRLMGFCLEYRVISSTTAINPDGHWVLGGPSLYTYDRLVNI